MPAGLLGHPSKRCDCCHPERSEGSIPVCHRPFLLVAEASAKATLVIATEVRHLFKMPTFAKATVSDRSTGSKQTLNGLFYLIADDRIFDDFADPFTHIPELFFPPQAD